MELTSQKMRKLAPELDPLRIGTGWKKEDLDKVQVMIESTYGEKESKKKAALVHAIFVQISVMARAREQTVSTTVLQAVR